MLSDFHSEMNAWWQVIQSRKWMVVFFSLLVVFLSSVLLILIWNYHTLNDQVAHMSTQMEMIVDVDRALGDEQREMIRREIEQLPMVKGIEFWSEDRSAQYIDEHVLSGYLGFLKKNQLEIPISPLFRIQLQELGQKDELESILQDRFGTSLMIVDSQLESHRVSFAGEFIQGLMKSLTGFWILLLLLFLSCVFVYGYFVSFLLSERSRGFHITQLLHLSPPYTYWPALATFFVFALFFLFLSVLFVVILSGQIFWGMSLILLGGYILESMIFVFLGRIRQ